jgi:acetolactate synthase regulatory subunit
MITKERTQLQLRVTARQSVTVLPRCLQILSRRGYILTELTTEPVDDSTVVLTLAVEGQARWHDSIVNLLSRVVEVDDVTLERTHE